MSFLFSSSSSSRRLLGSTTAIFASALVSSIALTPREAHACACGCGVFEVSDFSMYPEGRSGHGLVSVEWDFQDQDRNFAGSSHAPAANNDDKGLATHFVTTGLQYNLNRSWTLQLDVPYVFRSFTTLGGPSGEKAITRNWSDLGDIRLKVAYTGFFRDQSLGFSMGVKLPTGSFKHSEPGIDIDRDSQIGTGSTDVLLGLFYHHPINHSQKWYWFGQINADLPAAFQDGYRPGAEVDETLGLYYNGWSIGSAKIRPIAQVVAAEHARDRGPNAAFPVASGYNRVLLAPGIEIDLHPVMIDANVEFPIYQYVTGNQLVSQTLFRISVNYRF